MGARWINWPTWEDPYQHQHGSKFPLHLHGATSTSCSCGSSESGLQKAAALPRAAAYSCLQVTINCPLSEPAGRRLQVKLRLLLPSRLQTAAGMAECSVRRFNRNKVFWLASSSPRRSRFGLKQLYFWCFVPGVSPAPSCPAPTVNCGSLFTPPPELLSVAPWQREISSLPVGRKTYFALLFLTFFFLGLMFCKKSPLKDNLDFTNATIFFFSILHNNIT